MVWMIGTTSIAGNVRTARMEIWNGTTTISGNFRFDTSLLMRAGTRLIVTGSITCPSGATASIDPTAVITGYGSDNCQAV